MADHFKNLAHSEDQSTFIMICMGLDVQLAVSASIERAEVPHNSWKSLQTYLLLATHPHSPIGSMRDGYIALCVCVRDLGC